jgi:Domain of unknown function (DUF3883)
MINDWSHEEVEAIVADYFDMLDRELRNTNYNKSEHRHSLTGLLNGRSDGSIERKHQNISAILIELGFPYISGYKPLRNYQQLLYNVVSNRLQNSTDLVNLVREQVNEPAKIPDVDDILASLVKPPSIPTLEKQQLRAEVRESTAKYNVDYLAQEANNISLGTAGEQFVIRFEQARLIHAGRDNLASRIEHIAATRGNGAGYDVLSFETTGQERLIEVKTTSYGPLTPFFITRNEVDLSQRTAARYYLYRTFDFRRRPKMFTKHGSIDRSFKLDSTQYVASVW